MSALHFSFRTKNQQKQIWAATHPRNIILRTDAKVCLLGDLGNSLPYENRASLEEADYIVVLEKDDEEIPNMLMDLGKNLCPHGNFTLTYDNGENKVEHKTNDLVLKMHKKTLPGEQSLLWQRYFHAIAQATPEASMTFLRMAQNMGVIERPLKKVIMAPTGHFNQDSGRVIDRKSKARSHNYGNFLK